MPRLRPLPPARALVALGLAATLAGCAHTVRVGGSRHLRVALTEYQLTPETVRAYAGTLTITVRNLGTRTHNLAVSLGSYNEQSPDLVPGSTTTMTLDLAPGKYMLRSTITGDQALGLWGSLDVVATRKT
ncbi:MAG TPA: cupredoxin domain-containing protein [Solirubrobacteraceae bacterium]|nr:cupredoxin domain-containing protein [Solirubrobacteraceae bacterium]